MPFRHVVMFKWEADAPDGHVDRVRAGLSALPGQIEQIRSYVHGTDVGESPGAWDYVLVADFDDVESYRTYRDHPTHQAFIADVITGNTADRAAIQYET